MEKADVKKSEATIKALEKENRDLTQKLKGIQGERDNLIRQLEQDKKEYDTKELASQTRYNELHNMHEELTGKYSKMVQDQETLQKQLNEFPSKITNLAAENKKLVKETSDMHYNLGLFYFEKQEYKRAIPEFERVIKLNPQDPEAYYYLGYIYAEYLAKRDKAIECFNKYLELAPRGTHSNWVKQYILSWNIWDGKEKVE
jgi:tetratricopeptide (TPR) repeat protein